MDSTEPSAGVAVPWQDSPSSNSDADSPNSGGPNRIPPQTKNAAGVTFHSSDDIQRVELDETIAQSLHDAEEDRGLSFFEYTGRVLLDEGPKAEVDTLFGEQVLDEEADLENPYPPALAVGTSLSEGNGDGVRTGETKLPPKSNDDDDDDDDKKPAAPLGINATDKQSIGNKKSTGAVQAPVDDREKTIETLDIDSAIALSLQAEEDNRLDFIGCSGTNVDDAATSFLSQTDGMSEETEVVNGKSMKARDLDEQLEGILSNLLEGETTNGSQKGSGQAKHAATGTFGEEELKQHGEEGHKEETGGIDRSWGTLSPESGEFVEDLPLERSSPRTTSGTRLDQVATGASNEFGDFDPLSTLLNETSDGYRIVRPGVVRVAGMGPRQNSFASDDDASEEEMHSQGGDDEIPHHPVFFPVEAQLVQGMPDREVQELRERVDYLENRPITVTVEPVPDKNKENQTTGRRLMFCGMALICLIILVGVAVSVIGVTVVNRNNENTDFRSPSPTLLVATTDAPTPAPTDNPTPAPKLQCFNSTDELRDAVDAYLFGSQFGAQFLEGTYGWPIGRWCVSNIQNFSGLFAHSESFNENLSGWDTSSAVDMSNMFHSVSSFDQDISSWDVSSVETMSSMFFRATTFDQSLSTWNVSRVNDMSGMFWDAYSFNQDLSVWDTSSAVDMSDMFRYATSFDQDISSWDVASVETMSSMFENAAIFNQNLSTWNVSRVNDMSGMFWDAYLFDQEIAPWDVSKVKDMSKMFGYSSSFHQDISAWDVANVETMSHMFEGAATFNQDLSTWNVSNVIATDWMFCRASSFNQNIASWDMSRVNTTHMMFYRANSFDQDISSWNVSNVVAMRGMFSETAAFDQDISAWDVSAVKTMSRMFEGATAFNQNISSWNVSNVQDMSSMFFSASSFNQDLSSWNLSRVQDRTCMFWDASSLPLNRSWWWWGVSPQQENCISLTKGPFCGGGTRGNGVCENGSCCSQHGWCGPGPPHCNW